MKKISNNLQEESVHKERIKVYYLIIAIVVVVVAIFVYINSNDIKLTERISDKDSFTEQEKLEILNSLSGDAENTLSIEEKREILGNISNNKPSDAFEFSEEGKLQILRSLQEE
ncbi:MAG: hypothetical protein ISR98_01045 [Parcubacteria group bacterium]|nr:hypothetical protein [Parcubacteria group bacterium]